MSYLFCVCTAVVCWVWVFPSFLLLLCYHLSYVVCYTHVFLCYVLLRNDIFETLCQKPLLPYPGDDPSQDIVPVSGSLQFISNVRQQEITLTVNADDIPEVTEVQKSTLSVCSNLYFPLYAISVTYANLFFMFQTYIVSLLAVTGGARIGESSLATVMILANDNPYGFVALEVPTLITTEEDSDSVALVPVVRRYSIYKWSFELVIIFSVHLHKMQCWNIWQHQCTLWHHFTAVCYSWH